MSETAVETPRKWKPSAEKQPAQTPATEPQAKAGKQPCVGLPVQYHRPAPGTPAGLETLPAILQRRSIVNPEVWDIKVSLSGAQTLASRSAVKFSEQPAAGCWSFLPG